MSWRIAARAVRIRARRGNEIIVLLVDFADHAFHIDNGVWCVLFKDCGVNVVIGKDVVTPD